MLRLRPVLSAAAAAVLLASGLGCSAPDGDGGTRAIATTHASTSPGALPGPSVIAISVDGLNVSAIKQLGEDGAPALHRMLAHGAGTLNARTEYERTITLPNHTSMVTSRRIDKAKGGHGVTWNVDRPKTTVQRAAGHQVGSVFSRVRAAGGTSALYSTKSKFSLFRRSWPAGVDTFVVKENQRHLVRLARQDIRDGAPTFTFLHVSLPDRFGHAHGGMSPEYLDAVRRTDAQVGTILRAVADRNLVVILTADHGFATGTKDHSRRRNIENYRIPFLVWGKGVRTGDLYEMNPDYRDPRDRRPSYAGRQPVRNGNVANLALDLLGIDGIPGSGIDPEQALSVD